MVVFAVQAGGDGTEVLEFTEEAFDDVTVPIEEGAERRAVRRRRHGYAEWACLGDFAAALKRHIIDHQWAAILAT